MDIDQDFVRTLERLCSEGIIERVYTHPSDPMQNTYRLVDVEGTRRALEELGYRFK